jgi:hypothetical protein
VSEPTAKGIGGAFAITGKSSEKEITSELLRVTPALTEFFVSENTVKGIGGAFAITGKSSGKEIASELLRVTPALTEFFVSEDTDKGIGGAFAITGKSSGKDISGELLRVTPTLTEFFVSDNAVKGIGGGFAITGKTPEKESGMYNIFTVQPERTEIYVKNNPLKAGIPGFSIFGLDDEFNTGELFSVTEQGAVVNGSMAVPPDVITGGIEGIDQSMAMGGGAVTDDGGSAIIEVGIIYSKSGILNTSLSFDNPAVAGIVIGDPAFADDFSGLSMSGLAPGTTYQVRAFAVNEDGATGYGDIKTFTTEAPFTFTVNVMDEASVAIPNATVTLITYSPIYTTFTNPEGDYVFGLAAGSYDIQVVADGYDDLL